MAQLLQQLDRVRVHPARGVAACAVGREASRARPFQYALGQDAARRIAGAQEQHVVDFVRHGGASLNQCSMRWVQIGKHENCALINLMGGQKG